MSTVFLVLSILCVLWGVSNFIRIAAYLEKHGIRVNVLLFRILFFRYMNQYKELTLKETGEVGRFYYLYIWGMILALVFAVTGLALRTR